MCPESRRLAYLWLKKAVRPQGIYARSSHTAVDIFFQTLDEYKTPQGDYLTG